MMNIKVIKKLPPIEEIIKESPLKVEVEKKIAEDREEVKAILEGRDPRLLVIVGPCSAWPREAVFEYAQKLKNLETQLNGELKIIMRVFIQKPRTTKGWTGPVNQPDVFQFADIEKGARYCRAMMIKILEMGLPIADEALFTHNAKGFIELLSWVAIGARSTEDQEHRIFASALEFPVGMKNSTSGSIEIGVNSIVAAQHPHVAVFNGYEVQTLGNEHAHLVLRGGRDGTNYSPEHIRKAAEEMKKHGTKNPAIIIDTSHDNSIRDNVKHHLNQLLVARESIENLKNNPDLREYVKGFMFESFIKEGNQKVDPEKPEALDTSGLSITDACLSFEQTESILMELAEFKKSQK